MKTFIKTLFSGLALSGILVLGGNVSAAPVLDFNMSSPTTGNLTYLGGATALVGTNIEVDDVVGVDTPLNNNVLKNCIDCVLNFTTGIEDGSGTWNFGAGGTVSITGTVDGVTGDVTLLSGTFTTATVVEIGGDKKLSFGGFSDTKDADLLDFYGLPNIDYTGGFNLSFQTTAAVGSAFNTNDLLSGDIFNSPVPIPAAFWLFGSGLVAFGAYVSRRRKSANTESDSSYSGHGLVAA